MVEYESFEDALKNLGVNEDELKRMVSEGQLRAYRDQDKMKFRKDDVESLKRSNLSDIGSAPSMTPTEVGHGLEVVEETDETILDLGEASADIDFEDTGETSVPTVDLKGKGGDTGGLTGELVFDEGDAGFADADATIAMDEGLSFDDDIGLETEPLDGFGDANATVVDGFGGQDDLMGGADLDLESPQGGMYGGDYMMPPMHAPQIQVQEKIKYVEILPTEGWVTKIIAAVFFIIMLVMLAGVGASNGKDIMGVAAFGFSVNNPGKNNDVTRDMDMVPMSEGEPLKESDEQYNKLKTWAIAGGEGADSVVYPGMPLVREEKEGKHDAAATGFSIEEARQAVEVTKMIPAKHAKHTLPSS